MTRLVIILALCTTLTACADRERINCPRTKNQALTRTTHEITTTTTSIPRGQRCA